MSSMLCLYGLGWVTLDDCSNGLVGLACKIDGLSWVLENGPMAMSEITK
jgi:hypothetical protein